jgi:hypothetical protein
MAGPPPRGPYGSPKGIRHGASGLGGRFTPPESLRRVEPVRPPFPSFVPPAERSIPERSHDPMRPATVDRSLLPLPSEGPSTVGWVGAGAVPSAHDIPGSSWIQSCRSGRRSPESPPGSPQKPVDGLSHHSHEGESHKAHGACFDAISHCAPDASDAHPGGRSDASGTGRSEAPRHSYGYSGDESARPLVRPRRLSERTRMMLRLRAAAPTLCRHVRRFVRDGNPNDRVEGRVEIE